MRTAAFFDLDDTILSGNSGMRCTFHIFMKRRISIFNAFRIFYRFMLFFVGRSEPFRFFENIYDFLKGKKYAEEKKICDAYFEKKIRQRIYKDATNLIDLHRNNGDIVVIVTNSLDMMVSKIKEYINIHHLISSTLEVKKGIITGKTEIICFGKNKAKFIKEFAQKHNIDLKNSYAYSDNNSDIEMLRTVGNPIAVNPKNKMKKYALKNKLKILKFTETGG